MIRDLVPSNGMRKSGNEAKEVPTGVRIDETFRIGRGGDAFDRGFETVRRRENGDLLGLGDGGEDDGLLSSGCDVRSYVDGGVADGAVRRRWRDFGGRGRGVWGWRRGKGGWPAALAAGSGGWKRWSRLSLRRRRVSSLIAVVIRWWRVHFRALTDSEGVFDRRGEIFLLSLRRLLV